MKNKTNKQMKMRNGMREVVDVCVCVCVCVCVFVTRSFMTNSLALNIPALGLASSRNFFPI